MQQPVDPMKVQLLDAMLDHVVFDGWSSAAFDAAVADLNLDPLHAQTMCPRGAVDLAILFHQRGDDAMAAAMGQADLADMRYSEKVAHAIWLRLEAIDDKEAVRRGTTLFALPHMAPDGAKLIWGTADKIWQVLGDTSEDVNWYTKRATLSGVYGSTVLYWLGDDSDGYQATWEFLDRRIANVMQFEKAKAQFKASPMGKLMQGPLTALERIKKPGARGDMPGRWQG